VTGYGRLATARRQILALLLACGFPLVSPAQPVAYVELLDPQLSRWSVVDAEPGTFIWRDGLLRVTGPNGWLRSDRMYADFDVEVQFRFLTDDADSGIFFRAIGAEAFLRGWPNQAYQLQMRNPALQSRFPPLGGLFRHGMPDADTRFDDALARSVTRAAGQWQTLEITVAGERVTARINGTPVLEAEGIGNGSGYIGIQGETPSLEFRSVRISPRD
jgi:hypothetical protein